MNGTLEERIIVGGTPFVLIDDSEEYIADGPNMDMAKAYVRDLRLGNMTEKEKNIEANNALHNSFSDNLSRQRYYRDIICEFITHERPWVIKAFDDKDRLDFYLLQLSYICCGIDHVVRNSWEAVYNLGGKTATEEKLTTEVVDAVLSYLYAEIPPTPPMYKE